MPNEPLTVEDVYVAELHVRQRADYAQDQKERAAATMLLAVFKVLTAEVPDWRERLVETYRATGRPAPPLERLFELPPHPFASADDMFQAFVSRMVSGYH